MYEILFSVSLRNIFAASYTKQTVKRNDISVFTLIVCCFQLNKDLGFRPESLLLCTTRVKSIRTATVSDQSCQGGFFFNVDLSIGHCSRTISSGQTGSRKPCHTALNILRRILLEVPRNMSTY